MLQRHRVACYLAIALAGSLASVTPAAAHVGTGLPGGIVSGFEHPFVGLDHLLAMMAVGLWGAFLGRPLIYALPVTFPLLMVVGAALGMFGLHAPSVEMGVAVSVVILGLCIAFAFRASVWAAYTIVALFALFHGYSHGVELPSAADPVGYSAGFVLATGLLHLSGIGVGLLNGLRHGVWATRGLGAIVALSGCWFVYRALGQ